MSLPESLVQSLKQIKGFDEASFRAVHQSGEQVTSIRFNPAKYNDESVSDLLNTEADGKVPWCSEAYYLKSRPSFTADPLFHAGVYYVQDASSMILKEALKQSVELSQPLKLLDLCAAPGGKSTLIQSVISAESLLVSNEVIKTRVNVLCENISKWGAANVIVTQNDPHDFQRLGPYFDVVVVDAPCSGSGLFRKDPSAIEEWSESHVDLCGQRQQRILADILPALKPGGVLLYSTCSYSEAEDEEMVDWLLDREDIESISLDLDAEWNIMGTVSTKHNGYGYRFFPDRLRGEGFFLAAFRKTGTSEMTQSSHRYKKRNDRLNAADQQLLKPYLKLPEQYFFIKQQESVIAMPIHLEDDLQALQANLYIRKAGVKLGSIMHAELIPDHELALSVMLADDTQTLQLDKPDALQYLRKETISVQTEQRGWALVRYLQFPLGWVKILPNRINNYYPAHWRILNK
ncbi:MAG: RNA methyltransferase [Chitinophagaceae bacterium]